MKKIAAGIIIEDHKILICQRKSGSYYGLKWEFPGGKVEEGESLTNCLKRELKEELNLSAWIGDLFYVEKFTYPDGFEFEIYFYFIDSFSGKIENRVFEKIYWARRDELKDFDFLEADKVVIQMLLNKV
jgi:8-oxo-dGTP diphosphatase